MGKPERVRPVNSQQTKEVEVMVKDKAKVKRTIKLIIAAFAAYVVISLITGIAALFRLGSTSMPMPQDPYGATTNILVLGMDIGDPTQEDNDAVKRTDTILVLNYDERGKLNVISVPRDMMVETQKGNTLKINSMYSVGGYAKVKTEIEKMLNIDINYIVKIDYNAFKELTDAVGGVKMEIKQDMIYDDDAQNLHINFKEGETVKLKGEKAEQFFRWRKNNDGSGLANGDLDRIENQHLFLSELVDKCKSPVTLFKFPAIMRAIGNNVETNMSPWITFKYMMKSVFKGKDNITMATAQGTPKKINGQDYLVYNSEANKNLISTTTNPQAKSVQEIQRMSKRENIKIKVVNGTKINGLASEVKNQLNSIGYSMVETGNTSLTDKSQILTNDDKYIDIIREDINIKKKNKKKDTDEYRDYDVIIILGDDFQKFGE